MRKGLDNRLTAQYDAIRDRLSKRYMVEVERRNLSLSKLLEQLSTDIGGFDISYTTLREALSVDERSNGRAPNMAVVIGLCRLWSLDYNEIFAPPDYEYTPTPDDGQGSISQTALTDSMYMGQFYGYTYSRSQQRDEIISMTLTIGKRGDSSFAKLTTEDRMENRTTPKDKPHTLSFTGVPVVLKKAKKVFIPLQSPEGMVYFLFFNYDAFTYDGLYFRKGFAITTATKPDRIAGNLVFEHFVLFQHELVEEKKKLLPGLLKVSDKYFWISEEEIDELMDDEEFAALFTRFMRGSLPAVSRQLYRLEDNSILTLIQNQYSPEEREDAMKLLCMLRSKAISPERIQCTVPSDLNHFAKLYLQQP